MWHNAKTGFVYKTITEKPLFCMCVLIPSIIFRLWYMYKPHNWRIMVMHTSLNLTGLNSSGIPNNLEIRVVYFGLLTVKITTLIYIAIWERQVCQNYKAIKSCWLSGQQIHNMQAYINSESNSRTYTKKHTHTHTHSLSLSVILSHTHTHTHTHTHILWFTHMHMYTHTGTKQHRPKV